MSTFGTMKSRIASNLNRTDLTSPIADAIHTAIKHYERERFYWNETADTFAAVAAQEYYGAADLAAIPEVVRIDAVTCIDGTNRWEMQPRSMLWIEDNQQNPATESSPTDYAYWSEQIRLYPVPDRVYTIRMLYVRRLAALSLDADTNAWVDDAEEMIRQRALAVLWGDTLHNPQRAAICLQAAELAANRLRSEAAGRMQTGRIMPWTL